MKSLMKFLKIIFLFFVVVTILINGHTLISKAVSGEDMPNINNYYYFKMENTNMEPAIKSGDLVIIKKEEIYSTDDIVTFFGKDTYITSRIINFNGDNIITKEDNNKDENPAIKTSLIIGKVVFKIKYVGEIMDFLQNPVVIVGIMLLGFSIMLYDTSDKKDIYLQ